MAWWEKTNITNDFWLEGPHVLVRVHVTPRRTFFNPNGWVTPKQEQKHNLLEALGHVRSIHGVSCKTYREFATVHGLWREEHHDSAFPGLWVGRTVFSRAPMSLSESSCALAPHGSQVSPLDQPGRVSTQGIMGPQQGGTSWRLEHGNFQCILRGRLPKSAP